MGGDILLGGKGSDIARRQAGRRPDRRRRLAERAAARRAGRRDRQAGRRSASISSTTCSRIPRIQTPSFALNPGNISIVRTIVTPTGDAGRLPGVGRRPGRPRSTATRRCSRSAGRVLDRPERRTARVTVTDIGPRAADSRISDGERHAAEHRAAAVRGYHDQRAEAAQHGAWRRRLDAGRRDDGDPRMPA